MTSFCDKFGELIKPEMRKIYSETAIEHSMNPRNVGDLKNADGFARTSVRQFGGAGG